MFDPDCHPDHPVVARWRSLVDRRLIGAPRAIDAGARARIAAAETIVCRRPRTGAIW